MSDHPPLPVRTLPGARWSCQACGHCCRAFDLGPVEPETLAVLEAADLPARWPPAAARPWYELRENPDASAEGSPAAWLTRQNGACIFLGEDQRCAIHLLLGEEAKPAFCREFPFLLVQERDGWAAIVRPTCARWHRSRVDGALVAPQVVGLPALPRAYPVARFAPARVEILPGLGLDLDAWYGAEPAILRLLDAPNEPPEATVAALRAALARATGRSLPQPDPQRYRDAVDTAIGTLHRAVVTMSADATDTEQRHLLLDAEGWLTRAQGWHPAPPLAADAMAMLNEVLRASVHGKLFHRLGGLPRALGLLLVEQHLVRCAASKDDARRLDAETLSGVLVPWWNLAAHGVIVATLRGLAPTLEQAYAHATPPLSG